jgi:chromosome segregation protein
LRIKSLQISGFKSFVDKTAFSFRPGITGIVGPNGCGKSNVVDAIRWAMGEQSPRRLRGKGMEDVIFAGSEVRSPVGMAEVLLTFDNGDGLAPPEFSSYAEIQVCRRLFRSGESEYLLNKTPCRLRDILDFFRDTGIGTKGYTIVEQGRIAEIVSAKAEERRVLIEEAAGISKYKARRREAERKLEATSQNLLRVRDVLAEIKRQISSIERQARKAAQYKRLREHQRILELTLAAEERAEMLGDVESGRGRLAELRDMLTATEAQLAERESGLEQRRLDLAECERVLTQGNEALFQLRTQIKELESRLGYERRERASLAEIGEARGREREQLAAQLEAAVEEARRVADELAGVESALADEGDAMRAAETEAREGESGLRALERERETENSALVEVLTAIARAEDRLSALADRREELDRRLRSADEVLEVQQGEATRADQEQQVLEDGLRGLLGERDRLMGLLRDAIGGQERSVEAAKEAAVALRETRELRETRRARLASLSELLERREDVGDGVRHLMDLPDERRSRFGVRGLVRDAFDADPGVERAVEAVLAERAEGLVVDGGAGALEALSALRGEGAGRALLVLDPAEDTVSSGFVPVGEPLADRVRLQPGFEALGRGLLADVNLVPSLDEALARYGSGRIPCTFVTPEGDVLTPDRVLRGGGEATQSGILTRVREARELETEVAELEARVVALETAESAAEATLAAASDTLDNLRNRHHTAALAVANHEKDLERTRERVKAIGEAQEGRVAERSEFLAEAQALDAERVRLEETLASRREDRAVHRREVDALGLRIGSAGRDLSRLEAVVTERRVQHQGREDVRDRLRAAAERARTQADETRLWIQQREAEIATGEERRDELAQSIAAAEASLSEHLRLEETARLGNEEKRDAYEREASSVRELEEAARGVRIELESKRDEAQQAELGLRELELRLQHLDTSIQDKWSVEIAHWKPPTPLADADEAAPAAMDEPSPEGLTAAPVPADAEVALATGDPEATLSRSEDAADRDARREARELAELIALDSAGRKERLAQIRKRVEAIGEVNLGAIEEHEELRERHRFLEEQRGDLDQSVEQLRDAIGRINRTSRKRFRETFEAVDERFRQNFPRLFRGGKASLALTEGEDVLEAGIEIQAQPPGKRLQSVNLLSGGEKTMTAIALLVSVFQVRPSPFFLLDEVDAALDDANVGRFNEIVQEMAQQSQFLLITHNKRTIEIADVLYGVTMEARGVSKLVAVEVH